MDQINANCDQTSFDLASALSFLDRDSLQSLVIKLANDHPQLIDGLQFELARRIAATESADRKGAVPADRAKHLISPSDVRKRVRKALSQAAYIGQETYYYDDDASQVRTELYEVVEPLKELANESTRAGDTPYAFTILEAVTDELISNWDELADYLCEDDDLFASLGDAWAEALLAPDCISKDCDYWLPRIDSWRVAGQDCGADTGLEPACLAASEGWLHPTLLRKLGCDVLSPATCQDAVDGAARRLTQIRVSMLVRQGKLVDAAKLSGADELHETYIELLVGLGLTNEAVAYALLNLQSAYDALNFAQLVSSAGEIPLSLQVAEHGMNLPGHRYDLAVWTRDVALTAGMRDLAVRAGIAAVRAQATKDDYTALKSLAEEQWPELRESILSEILGADSGLNDGEVDILLSEGLMLEALERVKHSYGYRLLERVVEACVPEYPEHVIPICRAQAEIVIDSKKADRYHHAIRWLALARNAYKKLDNVDEWLTYKRSLMSVHSRKSALMPALRAL